MNLMIMKVRMTVLNLLVKEVRGETFIKNKRQVRSEEISVVLSSVVNMNLLQKEIRILLPLISRFFVTQMYY